MAKQSLPNSISIDNLEFAAKPQTSRFVDIEGQRYGRLVVLGYKGQRGAFHRDWYVQCDCGTVKIVTANSLRRNKARSCGCYAKEIRIVKATTHGYAGSITYKSWGHMLTRCFNPRTNNFHLYGGRGITVCERWQTFENFLADMGERPSVEHSLDRIDSNGHYEPGNVRWATAQEQANHISTNRLITIDGVTHTLADWCRIRGLLYSRVLARLTKRVGWTPEQALEFEPPPKKAWQGQPILNHKLQANKTLLERSTSGS